MKTLNINDWTIIFGTPFEGKSYFVFWNQKYELGKFYGHKINTRTADKLYDILKDVVL